MADMTVLDFAAMVDDSFADSRLAEYRFKPGTRRAGALAAAVLRYDKLACISLVCS